MSAVLEEVIEQNAAQLPELAAEEATAAHVEPAARYNDLNTSLIAVIGVISAVGLVTILLSVQAIYCQFAMAEEATKEINVAATQADDQLNQQRAALANYGWVNREQGLVAIPIERAMDLVVREQGESSYSRSARRDGEVR